MLTIKIEINNVPTDRIDVANTLMDADGFRSVEGVCVYTIDHYSFSNRKHKSLSCEHDRDKDRFSLAKTVMGKVKAHYLSKAGE